MDVTNPVELIRQDHERIKGLFRQFEQANGNEEKKRIVEETLIGLEAHAKVEEEIFYPAVRRLTHEDQLVDMAEEEHHGAKMFVMELARLGPDNPHYEAKFRVLREMVEHHIEEEETQALPKIAQAGDGLDEIGREMESRWPDFREEAKSMVQGGPMATAKGMFEQAKEAMGRE
jgi:hypothetical protein